MKYVVTTAICAVFASSGALWAQEQDVVVRKMEVQVGGIPDGGTIPTRFAYCKPDGRGQTRDSDNINPQISWRGAPEGTQSFVIMVVDKDVPADFSSANQLGQTIKKDAPRRDFYHWVVVDIPASLNKILEGKASNGITQGGKRTGKVEYGITGKNDYSTVFNGTYGGYDGPCPPWNDESLHHYYFRVYALDVPSLQPPVGGFDGRMLEQGLKGHILAIGESAGTYTTNVDVLGGEK